jgi:ribonuclease R
VAAARELMVEHGFKPAFPQPVQREVAALAAGLFAQDDGDVRDLRSLLWSSIDNRESRDLDQIEYAAMLSDGTIRVLIAIADVDALVPLGSATDAHAAQNTTSVYTGVSVFPMLPARLSFDLTSLNEHEDRLGLVVELDVNAGGAIVRSNVFRALVRNHAKLDYATIGPWLDDVAAAPAPIMNDPRLEEQLRWQDEAARRLRVVRREAGALNLETIEARPVVAGGQVIDIAVVPANRARDLIENFMVSANVAMAEFLVTRKVPALRRVVRTPKRWDRIVEIAAEMGDALPPEPDSKALSAFLDRRKAVDPANFSDLSLTVVKLLGAGEYVLERRLGDRRMEGHFGLAVAEYTHSTAPNRRYPDLIIQRLAKSTLSSAEAPYSDEELIALALHCTEQEDAARKVERAMRKKAAAALLQGRIGESFAAIVTGASSKGTYVRLLRPPVEGRLVRGGEGLDVGVTVRVHLARVDFERGYIDFETALGARAHKLERSKRKKAAAARLLARIGETFDAVVTGASERGVYVRTVDAVEGRLMRGSRGLLVGDTLQVTLIGADAVHGFIDFARATPESARKAERAARKRAAAIQLQASIGEHSPAVVTGITRKATWVRTEIGTEGRLVRGYEGLNVGDSVETVLLAADPLRAYIDFARAGAYVQAVAKIPTPD